MKRDLICCGNNVCRVFSKANIRGLDSINVFLETHWPRVRNVSEACTPTIQGKRSRAPEFNLDTWVSKTENHAISAKPILIEAGFYYFYRHRHFLVLRRYHPSWRLTWISSSNSGRNSQSQNLLSKSAIKGCRNNPRTLTYS